MSPPCPAISAAKDVARPFFDEEEESLGRDTFIAKYNSKKVYGPKGPKGKELIKRITEDKAAQKAYKKAKKSRSTKAKLKKEIEQWLTDRGVWRRVVEYGRNFVKVGANSRTTIPVGGIVRSAREHAEGSALVAVQNEKGPYMFFVLGDEGLAACQAVQLAARGEAYRPIHNVFASFDDGKIKEIAFEQTTDLLQLFAEVSGQSVEDVLGGFTLEQVHAMSFEDAEALAMARGKEGAEGIDAKHNGALRFQSLAGVKIFIDDIMSDLEKCKVAAVPLQDGFGPYCFPSNFEARILKQNCHGGGTSRHGRDPKKEYEQPWATEPYRYVLDRYGRGGHLIDMKAKTNEDDSDLHAKVPIPGADAGSYARILKFEAQHKRMTTFHVTMSQGDGTFDNRQHHQILQQALSNSGSGMKNHSEFKKFLGGQTFEEKYRFTNRDERRYLRRLEDWQKRYPGIEFGKRCDVDHCVGRSKRWMNNVLFTNLCSHRWNQCMSAVRITAGDWCFGLGTKAYGNGND